MAHNSGTEMGGFPGEGYTPRAALAALGHKLTHLDFFEPIRTLVKIDQKTLKYRPDQKLYAAFVTIQAFGHRMTELTKIVRNDPIRQKAFGAVVGADQSVVQGTLDACTAANVAQMHRAQTRLFQKYSHAYPHDYQKSWPLLDVDMHISIVRNDTWMLLDFSHTLHSVPHSQAPHPTRLRFRQTDDAFSCVHTTPYCGEIGKREEFMVILSFPFRFSVYYMAYYTNQSFSNCALTYANAEPAPSGCLPLNAHRREIVHPRDDFPRLGDGAFPVAPI